MRLSFLLVPLVSVVLWACSSTEKEGDHQPDGPSDAGAEDPDLDEAQLRALRELGYLEQDPAADPDAVASEPEVDTQEFLQESGDRQALLEQRRDALAQQYLELGDQLLDRADFDGALQQYSQALDVAPGNTRARESLRRVQSLMGVDYAQAADFIDDAADREAVRRAQARISVEDAIRRGDDAMRTNDFATAVEAYREAQLILRYHPLIETEFASLDRVNGLLDDATQMQAEALAQSEREREQRAQQARTTQEREQQQLVENQMAALYKDANEAYLREDFKRAEQLARQVLVVDPRNTTALELAENARVQRHKQIDARTRKTYREQWVRTFEELDTNDLPQLDVIEWNLDRWREASARGPLQFAVGDSENDESRQRVLERLEQARFSPGFVGSDGEGASIEEVASFLQQLSGVNFLVSTAVREDLDEDETTIRLQTPERSVRKVLDLIVDTSENLRWTIDDGVVRFVTRDELVGGQVMRMYEVRDIIHPVPDFPSAEINVSPSGGLEAADEDFDEREGLVVTADALEALITDNIATDSWNDDPRNSIRTTDNGTLVVSQTPEVQEQIEKLLDDLREATGIMVDIQANFLKVEDNFLEDIGVDFRGLGQPGLGTNQFLNDFGDPTAQQELGNTIGQGTDLGAFYDEGNDGDIRARTENLFDSALGDPEILTGSGGLSFQWTYLNDLQLELILRAVSKSERVELVTKPRILVFNTARSNITVLNQVAYVQDFDVEIAQGASIADPIIDVIQDGVILDVRPVVSADRKYILMELRPTVAQLRRPIREQPTSLGTQQTVTIQLPEVDIQRVRTTVPMPDGGTVMLGGLRVTSKQNLQSGIPIVNKIPIVSFLFDRKGTFVSNQKLLILLKANIVIPREHEPSPFQFGG